MEIKLLRSSILIPWAGWWQHLPIPSKSLLREFFAGDDSLAISFDDRGFVASIETADENSVEVLINLDGMDVSFTDLPLGLRVYEALHQHFAGLDSANKAPADVPKHLGFCFSGAFEFLALEHESAKWLGDELLRPSLKGVPATGAISVSRLDFTIREDKETKFPSFKCMVEPRLGQPNGIFAHLGQTNPPQKMWPSSDEVIGHFKEFALKEAPQRFIQYLGIVSKQTGADGLSATE